MRDLLLLGLAGCAPAGLPSAQAPPPPVLHVTLPGIPGARVGVGVSGAAPGARVAVVLGESAGAGPCPPALGGACLGITGGLRALGTGVVGADGAWAVDVQVPVNAPPGVRLLQAVVIGPDVQVTAVVPLVVAPVCDDALEPNDAAAEASPAPPGSWSASICRGDEDWYRLDVPADGSLSFGLTYDPTVGDLDAELVDAAGVVRGGSYRVDGEEDIEHHNASGAPEAVWLRVWPVWASRPFGYDARAEIVVRTPCVDDAAEPDDGPAEARPWSPAGVVCEGDRDWLQIPVAEGDWLRVEAGATAGRLALSFVDAGGRLLGGGTGATAEMVATEAGVVYLVIALVADDPGGQGEAYALTLTRDHAEVCGPDALDPSGSPDEAAIVAPGVWPDLRVCGGHDWFAVDVAGGGELAVWLRYDPADGQLASQLFDPSFDLVAFSVLSGGLELLYARPTLPGRYVVHVVDFDDRLVPTAGGVAYTMTIEEGP